MSRDSDDTPPPEPREEPREVTITTLRQRVIEWNGISVDELVALCSAEVTRELRSFAKSPMVRGLDHTVDLLLARSDEIDRGEE